MISRVGQIMLYVNNQDEAVDFWTEKAGFHVISEESEGPMRWIEIAPNQYSETSIILHNKEVVAEMSPGVNLETPSLMFFTKNIDELHEEFAKKSINVGEIEEISSGRVFNFSDHEENYFAVMEVK